MRRVLKTTGKCDIRDTQIGAIEELLSIIDPCPLNKLLRGDAYPCFKKTVEMRSANIKLAAQLLHR